MHWVGLEAEQWVQSGLMDQTEPTGSSYWEDEVATSSSAQLLHEGRVEAHPVITSQVAFKFVTFYP